MSRNTWWIIGGLFLVTVFGVQFNQISKLKREVASVRAELTGGASTPDAGSDTPVIIPTATAASTSTPRPTGESPGVAGIQVRLANLERSVAEFTKGAEILMDRGMLPPSEEKLAQMQQKFFDPNTPEDEKLKVLGLLRRNGQLSDEVVTQGLSMLQSTTNANFKRAILGSFDGLTNSALKQPLFAMLQTETENEVRTQLVNALRKFTDDPTVEAKLWDMALNDPNEQVRNRARDAVTRGAPATPERLERLSQTTRDPNATLDERLLSFRALRLAKAHTPEMVSELAALAESTTDPLAKAKLLGSFNGLTDPGLMLPLVNALQDPNPLVRQKATDSLGSYDDPRVMQWLEHVLKNDTDDAVKREAGRALESLRRKTQSGGELQQQQTRVFLQ
ncbi:MAG TPA: HEAT repeat domain-containing protein [Candidatus Kapabacteria bacterium]|nr:HEAT repeat domain-containing protein [Candidatus Kapabacteria bacterium]